MTTVVNVSYPHRDVDASGNTVLYPESASLSRAAHARLVDMLARHAGSVEELATKIEAEVRRCWEYHADALSDAAPIDVHFHPPGHPDSAAPYTGPDRLTLTGTVFVAGWTVETGQLHGMSVRNAQLTDGDGNPVNVNRTGSE